MAETVDLHRALAAAVPGVVSVSVGRRNNKDTWAVMLADGTRWAFGNPCPSVALEKASSIMSAFDFDAPQADDVKAEARRRILARFPEWKQANMTARGVELTLVLASGGQWSQQEQAEAAALQEACDWIKQVRAASDVLEAMSPIPADYATDARWPA